MSIDGYKLDAALNSKQQKLMTDLEIYADGLADTQIQTINAVLGEICFNKKGSCMAS